MQALQGSGSLSSTFRCLCLGWSVNIVPLPSNIADSLQMILHAHTHTSTHPDPSWLQYLVRLALNNAKCRHSPTKGEESNISTACAQAADSFTYQEDRMLKWTV